MEKNDFLFRVNEIAFWKGKILEISLSWCTSNSWVFIDTMRDYDMIYTEQNLVYIEIHDIKCFGEVKLSYTNRLH